MYTCSTPSHVHTVTCLCKMTYYIKPPSGSIPLACLEAYCRKRLDFLLAVCGCHGDILAMKDLVEASAVVEDSECLIEGSKKDQISHFLLRLLCSQDSIMQEFVLDAETKLFNFRFSCLTEDELLQSIKPLRKLLFILETNTEPLISPIIQQAADLLFHMTASQTLKELVHAYAAGLDNTYMVIPFQDIPSLVAKRSVIVCNGFAYVPCSKLCDIMTRVFSLILSHGLKIAQSRSEEILEDERIGRLAKQVKALVFSKYRPTGQSGRDTARCEDVDALVQQFPLCMSSLHQQLRARHRLGHAARIQYTLFLKEVGLPVHEAIQFWRHEYLKPGCHGNNCQHSWQKDSKRYTYNIRHLYGLEGSRINYRAHCCSSIQAKQPGPMETGGCPFVHFDESNLRRAMEFEGIGPSCQDAIFRHVRHRQPKKACATYFKEKMYSQYYQTEKGQGDMEVGSPTSCMCAPRGVCGHAAVTSHCNMELDAEEQVSVDEDFGGKHIESTNVKTTERDLLMCNDSADTKDVDKSKMDNSLHTGCETRVCKASVGEKPACICISCHNSGHCVDSLSWKENTSESTTSSELSSPVAPEVSTTWTDFGDSRIAHGRHGSTAQMTGSDTDDNRSHMDHISQTIQQTVSTHWPDHTVSSKVESHASHSANYPESQRNGPESVTYRHTCRSRDQTSTADFESSPVDLRAFPRSHVADKNTPWNQTYECHGDSSLSKKTCKTPGRGDQLRNWEHASEAKLHQGNDPDVTLTNLQHTGHACDEKAGPRASGELQFHKPIDFYTSFERLRDGLR